MSDQPDVSYTQTSSDQNQLFDRDMEEALIGSVPITPDSYVDAAPLVSTEDFYLHRNRWIWEAFIELFKSDSYFDVLTVKEALETNGHLEDVGGLEYLISLTNRVPSSQHAESYARTINALAVRRRLITAAKDIATLAYRKDTSVDDVISDAEKAIFGVSQDRYKRDLVPISDAANEYLERLLLNASIPGGVTGLETGLKAVDKALDGLQGIMQRAIGKHRRGFAGAQIKRPHLIQQSLQGG